MQKTNITYRRLFIFLLIVFIVSILSGCNSYTNDDPVWDTYSNSNFSFKYPASWIVNSGNTDNNLLFFSPTGNVSLKIDTTFYQNALDRDDFEKYYQDNIVVINNSERINNELTVNKQQAAEFVQLIDTEVGPTLKNRIIFTYKDNLFLFITFSSPESNYANNNKMMNEILGSFKFRYSMDN
ncbi:MAG: PsbP-related protein [Bacillota bacterium]